MKRVLSMALCTTMLAGLTACGGSKAEPAPTTSAPAVNEAASAAESTGAAPAEGSVSLNTKDDFELTIMLSPMWQGVYSPSEDGADYPDFFQYVGEKFNELHPNVNVKVEIISSADRTAILNTNLQAGTPPDIVFESIFAMTDYAHMGALVSLDDLFTKEDLEDLNPNSMAEGNVRGTQFFYPLGYNCGMMAVNADYFREAGLEAMLPAEGEYGTWTPEEFKTALETLKTNITSKSNVSPWGLFCKNNQSDQYNNLYLRMFGAEMFNEDSTACVINSEEGVKGAEFIKELYDLGLTETGPATYQGADIREMFTNQEVAVGYAMVGHYTSMVDKMEKGEITPFEIALFTLPGEEGPISFLQNYGSCVFDSGDEDQIAWAKEFVKFYSSNAEYAKAVINIGIPSRASVAAEYEDLNHIKIYSEAGENAKAFSGGIPNYVGFRNLLYPTMQAILDGSKTPEEALDSLAADATALIEESIIESVLY